MAVLSYSKYSTYEACPRKYKYRYLDKIPTEKTVYMARGTEVHASIEDFINGKVDKIHPDIQGYYGGYFQKLKDLGARAEETFAVSSDWKKTEFSDPDALVRGVLDIIMPPRDGELDIFEVKTGRVYDDHVGQRHLYGTAALHLYPDVNVVRVTGIYVDKKDVRVNDFARMFQSMLTDTWNSRFEKLRTDTEYPMMPSQSCSRCPFSRYSNGPCEF